jgi:hypothetical protein
MENRDLLIIKYPSEGYKVTEISEQLSTHHSIIISESLIEKRLSALRKQYQAKRFFTYAFYSLRKNYLKRVANTKPTINEIITAIIILE